MRDSKNSHYAVFVVDADGGLMETKPLYQAGDRTGEVLPCPTCSAASGELVETGPKVLLHIGGAYAYHFDGFCGECGREVHWTASGQKLDRLIARIIKRRSENA